MYIIVEKQEGFTDSVVLGKELGVSMNTVKNWFRNGRIKHVYRELTIIKLVKIVRNKR